MQCYLKSQKKDNSMARLLRVNPVGVPQHIVQRGNNRQVCFASDEDINTVLVYLISDTFFRECS
ncbi:MAG TPA: hypothetical protein ENJ32_10600 [Crenotrichaceae bacterium]|nr:hypothetical protein [Crenotrichaceae bacterium]